MFVGISRRIGAGVRIGAYTRVGARTTSNPRLVEAQKLSRELAKAEVEFSIIQSRTIRLERQTQLMAANPTPTGVRRVREVQINLDADTRLFVANYQHLVTNSALPKELIMDVTSKLNNLLQAADITQAEFDKLEALADQYGW